jgi:hypothetical protein
VHPTIIILFVLGLPLGAALGVMGFTFVRFGAVFSGCAIAGFGLIVYWTVWTWMLNGYACFPSEAMAEFDSTRWLVLLLVTVLPIAALSLALGL